MKAMVAVSAVVALGLVTGCGVGDGGAAGEPRRASPSRADRGEGKEALDTVTMLGPDRLRHVELGAHEVPGFQIERAGEGAAGAGRPRTDSEPCRPLADALGSQLRPAPAATVVRTFAKTGEDMDFEGLMGMIRVSAYEGDGAADTLQALRTAATACADGFRMRTGEGEPQEFEAVRTLSPPSLGDEAVAFRLENVAERAPSLITAVRSGNVLAMFFATSLSDPDGVEIPSELVRAQVAKLRGMAGEVSSQTSAAPGEDDDEDADPSG
ncbi:hypothetical protein [Streptomyces olivoreticuli]|uniref:hypothetical protein n=1 Tax=Streptomyces olivoreticuli TaxID=68246 RepID=UPI000E2460DE|nr:hypothetical protein [Streptomyces olivoreticuli]